MSWKKKQHRRLIVPWLPILIGRCSLKRIQGTGPTIWADVRWPPDLFYRFLHYKIQIERQRRTETDLPSGLRPPTSSVKAGGRGSEETAGRKPPNQTQRELRPFRSRALASEVASAITTETPSGLATLLRGDNDSGRPIMRVSGVSNKLLWRRMSCSSHEGS